MSGIALLRLLKPLDHYKKKHGSAFYGLNKMYLMLEKQHNRGQDGAGLASIKFDMEPGERFISRARSKENQPIQDVFGKVNHRINEVKKQLPEDVSIKELKQKVPYIGELFLGHAYYGTKDTTSIEHIHPFLRQNNWMHRNLIMAGNYNLTNVPELFEHLVELGQHPKEKSDYVTILEKIGHFLDTDVQSIYDRLKDEGITKRKASQYIAEQIDLAKILENSSKDWDGGYAIAGLLGHGDSFVIRDPNGIRPVYYYQNEEIVAVASERPAIQTSFNVQFKNIQELKPGHALIIERSGELSTPQILKTKERKSCSFERIYFSRGNDAEIYRERKRLGQMLMPEVLKEIDYDTINSVFSYIPNTAETSFLGMLESAQDELNHQKNQAILKDDKNVSDERLKEILTHRIRTEKIAVKDMKLRTFITEDNSRDDLVSHVYDVTYNVIKPGDNLVVIDDSIVRGTTLRKSILGMLDRLNPKKIIVVSSAPQIRYPDFYGIDMPRFEDLIAFNATLELLKKTNQSSILHEVYKSCKAQTELSKAQTKNYIKQLYEPFTTKEISNQIGHMLCRNNIKTKVKVIYQSIENLHKACPKTKGDWYFTGNYPTPGGYQTMNKAFLRFYEENYKETAS